MSVDLQDKTDDYHEHIDVPWRFWLWWLLLFFLAGCGDSLTPCGCPFMTVCQPDPQSPSKYICVAAPRESSAVEGDRHDVELLAGQVQEGDLLDLVVDGDRSLE